MYRKNSFASSNFSDEDYYVKYGRQRGRSLAEQKEPLISQVTNAWRDEDEKKEHQSDDSDDDDSESYPDCCDVEQNGLLSSTYRITRTRRFRRVMLVIGAILLSGYLCWRWIVEPIFREDDAFVQGLDKENAGFGVQSSNPLKNIVQLQDLEESKIPGGKGDKHGKRRLIFVGDIHGCNDRLLKLLHKVGFDEDKDHLIATGDMVSKGPDSAGVVDTLLSHGASAVRGNHEDRIILAAQHNHAMTQKEAQISINSANFKDEALLAQLKPHHLDYLRSLPLILRVPAISPSTASPPHLEREAKHHKSLDSALLNDILVVHAGLVPAVPLLRQDPYSIMNMRSIHPYTHMPSANRNEGVAWERVWNWFQARLAKGKKLPAKAYLKEEGVPPPDDGKDHSHDLWDANTKSNTNPENEKEESEGESWKDWMDDKLGMARKMLDPAIVVYGHDSKRGLNLKNWSKGLDSGCVSGGELTALIVDAWGRQEIVSVDCKDQRKR